MLVADGGGSKRIEMESKARPAARWLARRGITMADHHRAPGRRPVGAPPLAEAGAGGDRRMRAPLRASPPATQAR